MAAIVSIHVVAYVPTPAPSGTGVGAAWWALTLERRRCNRSPGLILHHLEACFHELFYQRDRYRSFWRESDNGLGGRAAGELFFVVLNHRRTHMQPHIRFLKAEPDKHPIVIVALVGVSRELEVIGAFGGTGRGLADRGPKLAQFGLEVLWSAGNVIVDAVRARALPADFFSYGRSTVTLSVAEQVEISNQERFLHCVSARAATRHERQMRVLTPVGMTGCALPESEAAVRCARQNKDAMPMDAWWRLPTKTDSRLQRTGLRSGSDSTFRGRAR